MPQMEIQPEVKVKSREREGERRERERHGGSQSSKKPGRETSSRSWPEKLATGPWPLAPGPWPLAPGPWPPSFIVQKAFYTFDKTRRSMGNTKLCSVGNPDSFRISFCIQKETSMSGNFLSCSKGVNDLLEVPEVRCD